MKLQDISDKFRAHLRAVRGRLSGAETGEEQQRFDIDRIIRLHCEAELVKLNGFGRTSGGERGEHRELSIRHSAGFRSRGSAENIRRRTKRSQAFRD